MTGTEHARTELVLVGELMEWLRISRSTVYRMIERGQLHPVHFGDRPRFIVGEVEDLIRRLHDGAEKPGAFSD